MAVFQNDNGNPSYVTDFYVSSGKAGAEKIITKNGESYVALIDADRLDYYHRLERERIHLLLLDEAAAGLDDVDAGRTRSARAALQAFKRRRAR